MKKWLISLFVVALIAGAGFFGYQRIMAKRAAAAAPTLETTLVQRGDLSVTVEATGSLEPRSDVLLAFKSGGQVVEVLVVEGQDVEAGEVLARLDEAAIQIQIAQAELNLQSLTSPYAIADTEKTLADAIEALDDAEYARRNQQEGYRGDDSTIEGIKADLILAEDKVEDKQEKFDEVAHEPEDDYGRAVALTELSAAIEARDALVRQLNWYFGHPTEIQQDILDADVAIAEANLAAAQALLAELKGDPLPPDAELYLGPATTQLRQARISLESVQLALNDMLLVAPAAGTVVTLDVQAGEFVNLGAPVIVLSEVDALQAETNLDETDVARIEVGYPVIITLDAFPGVEFSGRVESIAPVAIVQSGVVLYPVTINLDEMADLPLRSGMTANVSILVESREAALLVPLRAIETEGKQAYVWRVTPEGSERVAITLGLLTDTEAEILSGLAAGEEVVVYAGPEDRSNVELEGLRGVFGGD
jgi:HlyD family secretion protein